MNEHFITYSPTPKQFMFHQSPAYEVLFGGAAGPGKLIHVDTLLPTPNGWVTMGDIRVGDQVFGPDGLPARVTVVSEVQVKEAYRLTFDDGAVIDAHDEHLWHTYTASELGAMTKRTPEYRERRQAKRPSRATGGRGERVAQLVTRRNKEREYDYLPLPAGSVKTTQEIVDTLKVRGGSRANHAIPVTSPLRLPERDLLLDPYLLGLWLGDGATDGGRFTCVDGLEKAFVRAGHGITAGKKPAEHYIRGLVQILRAIGVLGNKHIPHEYLWASESQRLALLQGLMDTDGCCDKYGCMEFTNTNKALADGVAFLARSMGIKATVKESRATLYGKDCGPKYRVTFTTNIPMFRLERKLARQPKTCRRTLRYRYIVSAERLPESIPMRCISIDNPSHLYLAGENLVATHNTTAAVIDAFARCYRYPGSIAYILRRTRPELMKSVLPEVMRWYPKGSFTFNSAEGLITLSNGSRIFLASCQYEKDKYNFQGVQIDWLYFEELTHFPKSIYDYLKTRVRTSKDKGIQPCIRCTSNPGGVGHGWVKKYFVDAGPATTLVPVKTWVDSRNRFEITTKQYIPALVTENPYINDSYILELSRKPDALRRALLLGEWDAFEGQVFTEFIDDQAHYLDRLNTHVIEPFRIPAHWRRYRGFDWGYTTPFAVVWAAVEPKTGIVYVYKEFYGSQAGDNTGLQMPSTLLAQNIWRIEEPERMEGAKIIGFADPSIYDARDGEGSVGDKMARQKIFFEKADNARLSGKDQFHSRFMFDTEGKPGMYIFNSCPNLIRTLKDLPYSMTKPEDVDTDAEDHAYDALRYVLNANPMPSFDLREEKRSNFNPFRKY